MVTEIPSTLCLLTVASLAALGWVFKDVLVKKADYVLDPQGAQSGGEVVKEAVGNGPWGGNGIPSPVLIPPWAGSVGSFIQNCFKTEPHQLV